MGCLYWLLQVFQFSKTNRQLVNNQYNNYGNSTATTVNNGCYRDDFPSPLLQMLVAFLVAAIIFTVFPLVLFGFNLCTVCLKCNEGDSKVQRCCQSLNGCLRNHGANCYVALAILSALVFFGGSIWGLIIICKPKHLEDKGQLAAAIIFSLLAVSSWFDVYVIGWCTCFGSYCCCDDHTHPWFCRTQAHNFVLSLSFCFRLFFSNVTHFFRRCCLCSS
ncbi:hypothetical protein RFI_27745 [Reticulomyxa filosa]|uniref:Uncharacterized protein n=1 Tax=Reticulomyxa filosa TaxID=46433 RepID=X6M842_RETFI|nr:hypothetical protein RFI_27745 [Reticulomyxa filosa]|eukprot:ETO09632.1 hypothetical protein RFI_27745 [Reticulomyxa filosa]